MYKFTKIRLQVRNISKRKNVIKEQIQQKKFLINDKFRKIIKWVFFHIRDYHPSLKEKPDPLTKTSKTERFCKYLLAL